MLPISGACAVVVAILSAMLFPCLRESFDERDAVVTIRNCGGDVSVTCILPSILRCPVTCGFFDRVQSVWMPNDFWISRRDQTDELIRALKQFRHLKVLTIEGSCLTSADAPPRIDAAKIEDALPGVMVVQTFD